ncbi:olfactory receptor 2Z1 [Fukomys damarensis]|uniref:Olfactory receptor n=1 Tax=Fukomys damarensis TaxID=885580 RepID=A0A091DJM4_FUKDA|nr:olfactory receptor 2Z1 [Fukomys damarensis]KFO23001.1 Olfactory receptor 2Z1 [Fukomys damarensis]
MMDVNTSAISDFILVNLFGPSGSHKLLFSLVAAMFIAGLLGNAILLFLIRVDSRLHTPMYFLLSQLSLFDVGFPLVTIPKMASDFLQGESSISFGGCAAQMFFLMVIGVAEGVLLALMSYDRYVAVCYPLQYPVLMRHQVCLLMVGSSWMVAVVNACVQTSITLHFPYCASHIVDHFFCEMPALLKLSCADTSAYELALTATGVLILVLPLSLIATSYGQVLKAVLHMRSVEARNKAFATCSSHITVVGLFYGAAVFMYMVPSAYHSPHQDNMVSLFYSLITPTLNPLIYSLRNRDVRMALVKVLGGVGVKPQWWPREETLR